MSNGLLIIPRELLPKQPLQQSSSSAGICEKDGIAELLKFIHDFVIEARVVIIGAS